jgi:hypothetical protein
MIKLLKTKYLMLFPVSLEILLKVQLLEELDQSPPEV